MGWLLNRDALTKKATPPLRSHTPPRCPYARGSGDRSRVALARRSMGEGGPPLHGEGLSRLRERSHRARFVSRIWRSSHRWVHTHSKVSISVLDFRGFCREWVSIYVLNCRDFAESKVDICPRFRCSYRDMVEAFARYRSSLQGGQHGVL